MPLNGKKILKLKPQPTQINAKRERRTKRQTDRRTDRRMDNWLYAVYEWDVF